VNDHHETKKKKKKKKKDSFGTFENIAQAFFHPHFSHPIFFNKKS
jgi:hypothetical protein